MFGVQNMQEEEIVIEVKKIKSEIESYANGGLKHIHELLAEEPDRIDDDKLFVTLLSC